MGWNPATVIWKIQYWRVGRVETFVPINFGIQREDDKDWDMICERSTNKHSASNVLLFQGFQIDDDFAFYVFGDDFL